MQSVGEKSKKKIIFLNLNEYLQKTNKYISTYINPMIKTNQKPITDTQK